jgi:DNA-binding transcriptional LysR family regulator
MNVLDAMQAFVRVGELASFTQAADALGWPKASVSTAVQQLEAQLGTRLLHRTTRRVQLTPDGQAYLERCKDVLADMDELQTMFQLGRGATLTGRLRVDMPLGVSRQVVMPRLGDFLAAHPGLTVELCSTDRRVDLVREGFDCVLRVGPLGDSPLIARPLGHYRLLNVASPAYLAAHGTPQSPDDLLAQGHRQVHYSATLGSKPQGFEWVDAASGETRSLALPGSVTVNNSDAYHDACLAGLGLIQSPDVGLRGPLLRGQLVEVLPQHRAAPMPVSLLYAHRRHLPQRVQVFMAWLEAVLQPHLLA